MFHVRNAIVPARFEFSMTEAVMRGLGIHALAKSKRRGGFQGGAGGRGGGGRGGQQGGGGKGDPDLQTMDPKKAEFINS